MEETPRIDVPRVVFFDAGLTLLTTRRPIAEHYSDAARRHGGSGSFDDYQRAIAAQWPAFSRYFEANGWLDASSDEIEGRAWRWFTDRVAVEVGEQTLDCAAFNTELVDLFGRAETWECFADVERALAVLRDAGIRVGLISNWDTRLRGILEQHGLADRFDPLLISSEVGIRKPHPEMFRRAARGAGCDPAECWHVGDSLHDDVEGARAAGFIGILVDRDGRAGACDGTAVACSLEEVARWARDGVISAARR